MRCRLADHQDLVEAQGPGAIGRAILAALALQVSANLSHARLADIDTSRSLEMTGLDPIAHDWPPSSSSRRRRPLGGAGRAVRDSGGDGPAGDGPRGPRSGTGGPSAGDVFDPSSAPV